MFPIKLFLTATCGCVHLMSSRVEWDGGISVMNTQLEGIVNSTSQPDHEYLLLSVAVSFRSNSLLPSFPGSPHAQATESWAEPGHESFEDGVYNRTVYSVFMKNF